MALLLASCFPEDERVQPHEPGDLQVGSVAIGPDYQLQSFYDLNTNSEVSKNSNMDWDLGFESAGNGYRIILNSSRFMYAGNTGEIVFEQVDSKDGIEMLFDHSSGHPDSMAIGEWYFEEEDTVYSKKEVYIIDLGMDEASMNMGFKKVQFDLQDGAYVIRYAELDGSNEGSLTIDRDAQKNFVCISFENGIVDIEPHRESWTMKVSRYTTMLQTNIGEDYPYIVFGVLLNPYKVVAALDTVHDFADIVLADTSEITFSQDLDAIGYEWKYYNFDAGVYTVVPEFSYIIRDRDGYYYKLRFVDFYNDTGDKGHPEFEFLAL
jgi:hypothetical protein